MWILGYVMQSDSLASKIHHATRTFDRNTTGLPVAQLLVRLCIMPSAELDEVRLHHVRQKYLTTEEDLRRTEKHVKQLQQRRDKQRAKLEKLETVAAEKAKSGLNKDPFDQTLEEVEQTLRNSFNPDLWHQQGLDAVRKAKEEARKGDDEEGGVSPEQPKTDSIERLFSDLSKLASRVQDSEEFKKATEAAQSAASTGAEQAQKVLTQAQQMDIEQLRQEALDKGKAAQGAMSSAVEQAQQSEAFQMASSAAKQAQDDAKSAVAKGSRASSSGSK